MPQEVKNLGDVLANNLTLLLRDLCNLTDGNADLIVQSIRRLIEYHIETRGKRG